MLLHDDFLTNNKIDFNKDNFRDQPTGNLFSAVNRWNFDNSKGLLVQLGVKLLWDNKTGGETNYNSSKDKFTTNYYGLGIETKRYEVFGKIGYVFPEKKFKSIGLFQPALKYRCLIAAFKTAARIHINIKIDFPVLY